MNIEMYIDKALAEEAARYEAQYNRECAEEFDGTGDPEKDIANWEEWDEA